ncbi:BLUF domain-containing protein [Actinomycetospora endophytica]|uniref:BLUF domain-containing protein n=1 Tax=Actinomycetospora endophytica TaxID=2291215 RepID=A0ABS8P1A2_9PSEU|nr:BLUF domain-containing protein [Actinomycetospora endophytica]
MLAEIFRQARAHNRELGITGALLLTDHYFVQVLEGSPSAVNELYERIGADTRHEALEVLETTTVPARTFPRWSMAEVSAVGHADIPLHALGNEIHARAATALTGDQRAVLARMRNTIGADLV